MCLVQPTYLQLKFWQAVKAIGAVYWKDIPKTFYRVTSSLFRQEMTYGWMIGKRYIIKSIKQKESGICSVKQLIKVLYF